MSKEILLTQGRVTIVDDEDFLFLNKFKWHISGHKKYSRYAVRNYKIGEKWFEQKMHRIILDAPIGFQIDHVDGDGLNNQKENLRVVTSRQNQQNWVNFKKKSSSHPGVSWDNKDKRWKAQIRISGVLNRLGAFVKEEDAFLAYQFACNLIGEPLEYASRRNRG
ncbi:MAG: hypothetical protein EHJ95_06095 [Methanobacteriota archaeon]|nr:MAG: hypothetical protein EHJ95_06095 [Euryarchaeota archaeon]